METIHMTDTTITAHETGKAGRPLSPANRRARLRLEYINAIGPSNLTPAISEAISSAAELTVMAAEVRSKVAKAGGGSTKDLLALIEIENAVSRAIARLPLPAPTNISTVAA
jgi:hypothetical protein